LVLAASSARARSYSPITAKERSSARRPRPSIPRRAGSSAISERSQSALAADELITSVARYYSDRLDAHGTTPQGVDWSSESSQQLRFTQLLRLIDGDSPSIIDYGCGYGALAQRLVAEGREFRYVGFDVSDAMVEAARALVQDSRCRFTASEKDIGRGDFTVASGIFNVRLHTPESDWHDYVLSTCDKIAALSERGFALNMLTRYADPPLMRDELYYADPMRYFAICKARYSRNVALLHDYDLYEFTLIVRLGAAATPLAS
jgi:SAM-dependent methyltransferase